MAMDPRRAGESLAEYLRRRAVDLERVSAGIHRTVLRDLAKIEREILERLESVDPTGVTLTAAQRRRLEGMLTDVNARIASLMRNTRDQFGETLAELADIEASAMVGEMKTVFTANDLGGSARVAPRALLEQLASFSMIEGAPIKDWWSRQSVGLRQRFTDQMRLGVAQGETLQQLVQRVRGRRANGFRDGLMETTRNHAEILVRTSVNSVTNDARLAVFQANADIIEALEHLSTLDSQTTVQCAARDGLRWSLNREPIGHSVPFRSPPIHWGCRSVMAPILFGADRLNRGQRASADGPRAATLSFEDWLRTKSAAEQGRIIGVGRAKLWRQGQLSLAQMLDFRGEPLTLGELRSKYQASGA